jgi:sugar/nucleoside kinase (ribokinase family)
MKKYDVLVIGELNVDLILNHIDAFPRIGTERLAQDMQLVMGSSSAIFASNLSVLGPRVAFLGITGNDEFGKLVMNALQAKQVSTEFIICSSQYKTGATIVLNYGEERAMITHPGAMEHLTKDNITSDILKQCHHIHISSVFLQPGIQSELRQILKSAKKLDITTSLDTQWDPLEKWNLDLKEILPLVDIFLPNIQEFMALTKTKNINHAIETVKEYTNIIAIKMGNKGSLGIYEGKSFPSKPFLNKKVIDAIGAGDSFNAGFIFKFLQHAELNECLQFGNLMGAINTTASGGTAAFVNYDSVKEKAEKRFNFLING